MTPKFELPNKKIPFQKVRFLWNFDRRLLSLVITISWNLKVLPCREPKWRRFCHSATSFGMKNRLEWKIPFQKVRFLWNFDRRVLSLVLTIAWNLKVLPPWVWEPPEWTVPNEKSSVFSQVFLFFQDICGIRSRTSRFRFVGSRLDRWIRCHRYPENIKTLHQFCFQQLHPCATQVPIQIIK